MTCQLIHQMFSHMHIFCILMFIHLLFSPFCTMPRLQPRRVMRKVRKGTTTTAEVLATVVPAVIPAPIGDISAAVQPLTAAQISFFQTASQRVSLGELGNLAHLISATSAPSPPPQEEPKPEPKVTSETTSASSIYVTPESSTQDTAPADSPSRDLQPTTYFLQLQDTVPCFDREEIPAALQNKIWEARDPPKIESGTRPEQLRPKKSLFKKPARPRLTQCKNNAACDHHYCYYRLLHEGEPTRSNS